MKNNKRTRAFRRHKSRSKLLKRIKQWNALEGRKTALERFKKDVLEGKSHVFLRHTSTVCSCYLCSKHSKYSRKVKHKSDRFMSE